MVQVIVAKFEIGHVSDSGLCVAKMAKLKIKNKAKEREATRKCGSYRDQGAAHQDPECKSLHRPFLTLIRENAKSL